MKINQLIFKLLFLVLFLAAPHSSEAQSSAVTFCSYLNGMPCNNVPTSGPGIYGGLYSTLGTYDDGHLSVGPSAISYFDNSWGPSGSITPKINALQITSTRLTGVTSGTFFDSSKAFTGATANIVISKVTPTSTYPYGCKTSISVIYNDNGVRRSVFYANLSSEYCESF